MAQFSNGDLILNGKYRIERLLGEGAFGEVYLATHLRLNALRALKILHKEEGGEIGSTIFGDARRRFELESRLGARLGNHPHVIPVYDFDEEDGLLVLAMEYAAGGSLQDRLEKLALEGKSLAVDEAVRIARQIADGLSALHRLDVVHRDLKPSNVLFDRDGNARVADLGLAQISHGESRRSTMSQPDHHPGTPTYMSPEQETSLAALRPASDVYALGLLLFEMVTLRNCALLRPGVRASEYRPDVPGKLDDVIARMLAENWRARPFDGGDARKILDDLLDEVSGKSQQPVPAGPGKRKTVPGAWWLLLILLLAVAILYFSGRGLFTVMADRNGTPTTPSESQPLKENPVTQATTVPPRNVATEPPATAPTSGPAPTLTPWPTNTPVAETSSACGAVGDQMVSPVDDMTLVCVPAGDFTMGKNNGDNDEYPAHNVYLDAYWIDQTEVSNAQYAQCVTAGECSAPDQYGSATRGSYYGNPQFANYPVVYVNWYQAAAYCQWAGRELPTEAQWEKAARGDDERLYPWGNQFDCRLGNFDDEEQVDPYVVSGGPDCDGYADTAPVGSYPEGASEYGALDMSGNIREWTADWYGAYPAERQNNPTGPASGDAGVLRGGSMSSNDTNARTSYRYWSYKDVWYESYGFRCAISEP